MHPSRRAHSVLSLALALAFACAAHRAAAHPPTSLPIAELTRRIAAEPGRADLHLERGELRRVAGDLSGASADYDEVDRLAPAHPSLALARAALALDAGDPATARRWLDQALAARPGDAAAFRLRARALLALGDRRAAIADLDAAIARIARPHPDLYLERARLQIAEGDRDGARAGLDEARARLGTVGSLEPFAIELDRADGLPAASRAGRADHGIPPVAAPVDRIREARIAGAAVATVTRGPYLQVGTATAITVRWRTSEATDSRVRYGTSPGKLAGSAADPVLTTEHVVRVTGLSPATRYYYSVGTSTEALAGDATTTFVTAPTPGTTPPVRAWIIGDSGHASSAAFAVRDAYAAWTGARGTDLWLMLGDNAYNVGTDSEYQTAVFDQYPTMLRQSVLWPTRGNHDAIHAGANNDYYEIFTMPAAAEAGGVASGTEAYYAYDWANIHFICLDSEGSNRQPGGAMLTWLANDLAANTRPWVVAYWHHPPYSKGSHDSDSEGSLVDMRRYALPVLEAGGVDLVLGGHSHSYERSFLLDGHYGVSTTLAPEMIEDGGDGRPDGDGEYVKPAAASSAHAGAVYAVAGSSAQVSGGPLNHPVMVSSLNLWGSMVLDVEDGRMDARFLSHTGVVLDSFSIVKSATAGTGGPPAAGGVRLGPGLPNPFTLELGLSFTLERAGPVRLGVHDAAGRRVATLVEGWREAGTHAARWDGRDGSGRLAPNGVYVAVLEALGERVSRKIAHLR